MARTPLRRTLTALILIGSTSLTACDPAASGSLPREPVEEAHLAVAQPPDPASKEYVHYTSTRSERAEEFNSYQFPEGTRSVAITGRTVIFDANDETGLVVKTHGHADIKALSIDAKTVVFRRPMDWPGTTVTIRAEEIRFEDVGGVVSKVSTVPEALLEQPPAGVPGKLGLPGGSIVLLAKRLVAPGTTKRFVTTGGKGQKGGAGKDGEDGKLGTRRPDSLLRLARSGMFSGYIRVRTGQHPRNGVGIYTNSLTVPPFTADDLDRFGIAIGGELPTKGEDATPAAAPGDGGKGGDFITNLAGMSRYTELWGGSSGNVGRIYKGGAPKVTHAVVMGSAVMEQLRCPPVPTPQGQEDRCDWPLGLHNHQPVKLRITGGRKLAIPFGLDAFPTMPANLEGVRGQLIQQSGKSFAYLTPQAMAATLQFAEDAFITGYLPLAREELTAAAADIAGYVASPEWNGLDEPTKTEFLRQSDKIASLLEKLDRGLDYFGNPPGWVPALSLEANKLLFENEVEWAIRTIYLAEWLTAKDLTKQKKVDALGKAKELLHDEIVLLSQQMNDALDRLPDLEIAIDRHKNSLDELGDELKAAEERLLEQVMEARKVPIWKRALRLLAAVAKAVPVPYVNAAGSSLALILDTVEGADLGDLVSAADVVLDWRDAIDPLKEAPAKAEEGKPKAADPDARERADRAKFRKYIQDIRGHLKKQDEDAAKMAGPKADIEKQIQKELDRLKEIDPEYQRIADAIKNITEKREALAKDLASTASAIETALQKLSDNYDQIAAILPVIENQSDVRLGQRARVALADMRQDALERLRKYQYLLARSFEYRMLAPYQGDLRLVNLFQQMSHLIRNDLDDSKMVPDAAQFQTLSAAFRTDLSRIADAVAGGSGGQLLTGQVDYPFTAEQLTRLNDGEVIELDFWELGAFAGDEQEIRIANVRVMPDFDVVVNGADPLSFVDIDIEHDGTSRIWSRGAMQVFRHYNLATETPMSWTGRFKNGQLTNQPVSDAVTSLLHAVLGFNSRDVLLFARPAAWANLRIQKNIHGAGTFDVRRLRIQIDYDYARRATGGYAARRAAQDAQIAGLFQTAIGRAPTYAERRTVRERLDLGDLPGDIGADLERDHAQEHFEMRIAAAFSARFRRAPTVDERSFWAREMILGRSEADVLALAQRVIAFYGRPPTYAELVTALVELDAGTFDP